MDVIRLARKNIPLIVALAAVFVLVTALSVFIIRRETDRGRILMESDAARLASLFLEVDLSQSLLDDPRLLDRRESIVGLGLYAATGFRGSQIETVAWVRYRETPRDLSAYDLGRLRDIYVTDRERGTLVHIRPFAATRGGVAAFPPALSPTNARFIYVEMDVRDALRLQALYNAALAAVPIILAAVTALTGAFALKNAQYREQIQAQERLARLGEAARTLAHELKNPLNVIKLRARLARKTAGAEAAADLDVVEKEVEHLSSLTDRIREFLKDPLGIPETVELHGWVRDLSNRSGWTVSLLTDGQEGYPVRFDPTRLRSVMENLVLNALESMGAAPEVAPGSVAEIQLRADRSTVVLAVLDRGRGFDTVDTEKLFDPFYTTKITGSGIGLSISRRFVEAAGGRIELEARAGGGTEARVVLPRAGAKGAA